MLPRLFTIICILTLVFCKKQDARPVDPDPIDLCANKNCGFGKCIPTGKCQCDPGYELGTDSTCTILTEKKFEGSYQVSENCISSSTGDMIVNMYVSSIKVGVVADQTVEVKGLCGAPINGGFFNSASATIVKDSLFFYTQDVDNNGLLLTGKGKISANREQIDMTYLITVVSTGNTFSCTDVVFKRQ